jgi:hypothetical protein
MMDVSSLATAINVLPDLLPHLSMARLSPKLVGGGRAATESPTELRTYVSGAIRPPLNRLQRHWIHVQAGRRRFAQDLRLTCPHNATGHYALNAKGEKVMKASTLYMVDEEHLGRFDERHLPTGGFALRKLDQLLDDPPLPTRSHSDSLARIITAWTVLRWNQQAWRKSTDDLHVDLTFYLLRDLTSLPLDHQPREELAIELRTELRSAAQQIQDIVTPYVQELQRCERHLEPSPWALISSQRSSSQGLSLVLPGLAMHRCPLAGERLVRHIMVQSFAALG